MDNREDRLEELRNRTPEEIDGIREKIVDAVTGHPIIDLQLEGDGSGRHLAGQVIHECGSVLHIAALDGGMASGLPSLMIRLDLPNGEYAIVETSVRAFLNAAAAIHAKFEDILHD